MKVVLDCNVIVSAARIDGTCRAVVDRVVRHHDIVLSEPILAEYVDVADRPRQATYRQGLRAVIDEIERLAVIVEPASSARVDRPRATTHARASSTRPGPDRFHACHKSLFTVEPLWLSHPTHHGCKGFGNDVPHLCKANENSRIRVRRAGTSRPSGVMVPHGPQTDASLSHSSCRRASRNTAMLTMARHRR